MVALQPRTVFHLAAVVDVRPATPGASAAVVADDEEDLVSISEEAPPKSDRRKSCVLSDKLASMSVPDAGGGSKVSLESLVDTLVTSWERSRATSRSPQT